MLELKKYGIVGYPLEHSLSPQLHNAAFAFYGVSGCYEVFTVLPFEFADFMQSVCRHEVSGLSVTIPYKQKIIPFLDEITPLARKTGAVNTVFWQDGKLWGDNTDVGGFLSPLETLPSFPKSALVLGSGGAACAVLCGLALNGCRVCLTARNEQKGRVLAKQFAADFLPWYKRKEVEAELLVNATPLGMSGKFAGRLAFDGNVENFGIIYDIIYSPPLTPICKRAKQAGVPFINGQEMFVVQAVNQFFLWTGKKMSVKKATEFVFTNKRREKCCSKNG